MALLLILPKRTVEFAAQINPEAEKQTLILTVKILKWGGSLKTQNVAQYTAESARDVEILSVACSTAHGHKCSVI